MVAHSPEKNKKNVKHTVRLSRLDGVRLSYLLASSSQGFGITVTLTDGLQKTQETAYFPTRSLALGFLSLARRRLVTPLSLAAVYDDFIADALSLLP